MNWFKHDYSASEDDKILELRSKYGWEGYGVFFALLEYMCKTEKGIDASKKAVLRLVIGTPEGYLEGYLQDMLEIGLFYEENGVLWNQRIRDHLGIIEHRRQEGSKAGKKSAEARQEKQQNKHKNNQDSSLPSRLPSRLPATDKIREDKIREDKREREYARPKGFDDPELITFFTNNGSNPEEAMKFFFYYDSQNWTKSNNMPVSNWESLAKSWINRALHDPTFSSKASNAISEEERITIENRLKYYGY